MSHGPLPLITSCIYCLDYTSSYHFHPKTLVIHTQRYINMTPQTKSRYGPSNYCSLFEYESIRKMEILPIGFYDSNELSYIISVIVNCFCRNKTANKNLALPERVHTRHERYFDRKEKERDGTGRNGTVTVLNGTVRSCKISLYPAHKRGTVLSNTGP